MKTELLAIIIASVSIIFSVIPVILNYRSRKKTTSYDQEKNTAILEEIRNNLETRIYSLNDRIVQNEERWRDTNHLLLRNYDKEHYENRNYRVVLNEFLEANGISQTDLNIKEKLVFVLTPFHQSFFPEYGTIKETCSELELSCKRGDEKQFKADIFPQLLKYIVQAKIIIANMNGRSPNVMYELGIAHALNKNVILISRSPETLPVDIKSKRFLIYKDLKELKSLLSKEILQLR